MARKSEKAATNDSDGGAKSSRTVLVMGILSIVIIGISILIAFQSPSSSISSPSCPSVSIPRVLLSAPPRASNSLNSLNYTEYAHLRMPIILHGPNTLPHQWEAIKSDLLSAANLRKRLPNLPVQSQRKPNRSFATFHSDKPLERLSGLDKKQFRALHRKIPFDCVYSESGSDESRTTPKCDDSTFDYFSLRLSSLPESLASAFAPIEELYLSNSTQANLWLGRRGLITHTHFDLQFNFFHQLKGHKRFTLFAPPRQSEATLKLYPNIHPHQAHVYPAPHNDPRGSDRCDSEKASPTAFIADLQPGDVLVLPPLWFHHVETISNSVSMNVWSDADEYSIMDEIYALPIPMESEWTTARKITACLFYMQAIVNQVFDDMHSVEEKQQFFHQWFQRWVRSQRYHDPILRTMSAQLPKASSSSASLRKEAQSVCGADDRNSGNVVFEAALKASSEEWDSAQLRETRWNRGLVPAVGKFRSIRRVATAAVPDGLRQSRDDEFRLSIPHELWESVQEQSFGITSLLLANYFEWMLVALLGEEALVMFMQECLPSAN